MVRSPVQCRLERRRALAILGLGAIEPVGGNHFDSMSGQELVETVTIVSFVTDDSRRCRLRNHETKELLDEMAFGGVGWGAASGHRQPLSVNQDHDLDAFPNPSATDAVGGRPPFALRSASGICPESQSNSSSLSVSIQIT